MAAPRKEKAYEKYAWILVFVLAAWMFVFSIEGLNSSPEPDFIKLVTGMTLSQIGAQNQGTVWLILELYHEYSLTLFAFGAVMMAIAAFPLRKGHRFAWYISWLVPAWWLGFSTSLAYLNAQTGLGLISYELESGRAGALPLFLIFVLLGVLGQMLPYRKFFPKKQPVSP